MGANWLTLGLSAAIKRRHAEDSGKETKSTRREQDQRGAGEAERRPGEIP
jgi:hypothetical protein